MDSPDSFLDMAVRARLGGPSLLHSAELESRRFGLRIGRASLDSIMSGPTALIDEIAACDFDVVILRYPASDTTLFARLMGTGFHVIHADSLVYAEKSLPSRAPVDLARAAYRVASHTDAPFISEVASEVFDNYGSHYSANPLFAPELVRAGYVEWANSFIEGQDRSLLLVSEPGDFEVKAFTAVDTSAPGEIALAGVRRAARRQGWHGRALAAAEDHLQRRGCESAWTSTQIHNIAVQRTWMARGYRPHYAVQTVHLVRRDTWEPGRDSADD